MIRLYLGLFKQFKSVFLISHLYLHHCPHRQRGYVTLYKYANQQAATTGGGVGQLAVGSAGPSGIDSTYHYHSRLK